MIYFNWDQNGKIDHFYTPLSKHMLQRQVGRLLCQILFTLGVPATKGPQEGKKVGILPQAPYTKIANGKSRLDLRKIKQEELIQALQKAKTNLFQLLMMMCV